MDQVRLTNFIRQYVLDGLIAKRFSAEDKALKKEKLEFGTKAYRATYPEWKRMAGLPKGWMSDYGSFTVRLNGERHSLRTDKEIRLPVSERERQLSPDVVVEFRNLLKKEELFESQRDSAVQAARSVLWSVSTLKRLLEVWPEAEPFLPKDLAQTTTALALPISQLNAVFKLGGVK